MHDSVVAHTKLWLVSNSVYTSLTFCALPELQQCLLLWSPMGCRREAKWHPTLKLRYSFTNPIPSSYFHLAFRSEGNIGRGMIGGVKASDFHYITTHMILTYIQIVISYIIKMVVEQAIKGDSSELAMLQSHLGVPLWLICICTVAFISSSALIPSKMDLSSQLNTAPRQSFT